MLGVRAWTVRVSVDFVGHWIVRFSLVVDGLFVPTATWRFVMDIRRITADRAIFSNFVGCKPISPIMPDTKML